MILIRSWQKLLNGLMIAVLLCFNAAPLLAALHPVTAPTLLEFQTPPEDHAIYCHCQHCAGKALCCCKPTGDPFTAATMKAVCDSPDDLLHAQLLFPSLPQPSLDLSIMHISHLLAETHCHPDASHRTPDTLTPPPRSL